MQKNWIKILGIASFLFLGLILSPTKSFAYTLNTNTKMYVTFDGGDSTDQSGNNNNLLYFLFSEAPWLTTHAGVYGDAWQQYDNVTTTTPHSSYNVPSDFGMSYTDSKTISLWFKDNAVIPTSTTADQYLAWLGQGNGTNGASYHILYGWRSGQAQVEFVNEQTSVGCTYPIDLTDKYHNLALVYDNSTGYIYGYVDGLQACMSPTPDTGISSGGASPNFFSLGARYYTSDPSFGNYDDVYIENRAVPPDVINSYYRQPQYSTNNSIEFNPTNFTSNFTASDFSQWSFIITATKGLPNVKYGVNYADSTSTEWTYNDTGIIGTPSADIFSQAYSIPKSQTLGVGNNKVAVAYLVDYPDGTTTPNLIASSTLLMFNISTGTPTILPNGIFNETFNTNPWNDSWCPTTTFGIDLSYFGDGFFDVGKGLCQAFSVLFVPNLTSLQGAMSDFTTSMQSHIPFVYFYEVYNWSHTYDSITGTPLAGNATTTYNTLLNFRLKIDAAHIDLDEHWLDVTDPHFVAVWAYPYEILQWSLWLLLAVYFVNLAVRIFKSEPN